MGDLRAALMVALEQAKLDRDAAGRSERGRHLALVVTKVEEALLWAQATAEVLS